MPPPPETAPVKLMQMSYPAGGTIADPRPDEFVLGFDSQRLPQPLQWADFSAFARATGAFPVGFPPRELTRPMAHYRYRATVVPSDQTGASAKIVGLSPDWEMLKTNGSLPNDYHFLSVEGVATDNQPIGLARTALSGLLGRNPRDPAEADRAVVLVDPFAGQTGLGPEKMDGFPSLFGALGSMFTQQTRYNSQDMALAADANIFSRFIIVPRRDGHTGGAAIASDGMGAFIGFASQDFMRHDYLLGRRNCQRFLQAEFVLTEDNPVFAGVWTEAQKAKFCAKDAKGAPVKDAKGRLFLPLVPLMGDAAIEETTDPWPRNKLDPDDYREAIEARFKAVVDFEGKGNIGAKAFSWFVAHTMDDNVADFAIKKMEEALTKADLA